jgi:hypothetical protein
MARMIALLNAFTANKTSSTSPISTAGNPNLVSSDSAILMTAQPQAQLQVVNHEQGIMMQPAQLSMIKVDVPMETSRQL